MTPSFALLAAALALIQPEAPRRSNCFGTSVSMSGPNTAMLDDAAVAELRRFARDADLDDYRLGLVVFAPFGFNRSSDTNRRVTQERGEIVRAHLIAAGLRGDRIRVMRLGEHAGYPFPPAVERAEAEARRAADGWTDGASVIVEFPAGHPVDCSRFAPPFE